MTLCITRYIITNSIENYSGSKFIAELTRDQRNYCTSFKLLIFMFVNIC